jgi:hypothetical protein
MLYFFLEKRADSCKSFLFGYPMSLEKRNGIMEKAETLAGG